VSPISRTHTGPNPSFFRFIKHMSRDSSKDELYRASLSSSSSLKKKEVLINHDGGEKLKEVGQVFWNPLWQLLSPLNMAPVCVSSYSWVICLSLSHTNSMCHYTFSFQSKSALIFITLCSWYSSSQCFQVICHASSCSREVSLQTIHLQYYQFPFPVSVHTHLIHHLTSLSCVSFMSMMGDTSRPSFDESFPVDFNTLSRN
jgi:hypothetical protein